MPFESITGSEYGRTVYISLVGEVGKMYRVGEGGEEGGATKSGTSYRIHTEGGERRRRRRGDGERRRVGAGAWRVRDPKNVGCGGERDDRFLSMIHRFGGRLRREVASRWKYMYIYVSSNGTLRDIIYFVNNISCCTSWKLLTN